MILFQAFTCDKNYLVMFTHFILGLWAKIAEKVDFEIQKYHIYAFSTKSVPT